MSPRLAWLLPLVTVAVVCVMVPLSRGTTDEEGVEILFALAFVTYATVGALIASRHPRNPVGWLFAALGLGSAVTETLYAYAAGVADGTRAGRSHTAAAWVSATVGEAGFILLVLLLLLFPDGRFLSRRWRAVGVGAIALGLVWSVATALEPGPISGTETVDNPLGIQEADAFLGLVTAAAFTAFLLLVLVGAASVFVRYRVAGIEQRQQIKWLAIAAAFAIAAIVTVAVVGLFTDTDSGVGDVVTALLVGSAIIAFPVGAAVAILRHRLYDIDLVIKRTLVYGSLTAMLVAAYLGMVLGFRLALSPVTGESDLAVAASTLAVAALFRPLRSRVQSGVDRRFYRQRYDAARTLEAFGTRLRDQLDLEALGDDLRQVVRDTVQPAHVTLWLRQAQR